MIHTIQSVGVAPEMATSGMGEKEMGTVEMRIMEPTEEMAQVESDSGICSSSSNSISCCCTQSPCLDDTMLEFTRNVDGNKLDRHADALLSDFDESLSENSKLTMLPNFNISPTGKEEGDFLIIDLGGSTLRIAVIQIDPFVSEQELRSERVHIVIERKWHINDSSKNIDMNFFKWIGTKINETLQEQTLINTGNLTINTGISWSFPLDQLSHNSGRIVYVGKGYSIAPEVYNQDLKALMEKSLLDNFNINIDIKAIINDSLAVYSAGSFLFKNMKLAIVLGTGLNMCCSLKTRNVHESKSLEQDAVLFNTELSLFGHTLISDFANKYDHLIDKRFKLSESMLHFKPHMKVDPETNEIFQPSELMTSGRYLSELTRLILIDLIEADEIFTNMNHGELTHIYRNYEGITGELMCYISEVDDYSLVSGKLCKEFGWENCMVNDADIDKLKIIVQGVIKRAAFIVAITIISFIKLLDSHNGHKGQHLVNIGYVGSVLFYFKSYRNLILKYVNDNKSIQKLNTKIDFKSIDNSSIVGAAIGAAYYK